MITMSGSGERWSGNWNYKTVSGVIHENADAHVSTSSCESGECK